MSESRDWSVAEFGRVDLGDTRRTERLVAIGAAACERPCGRVAAVFLTDREREGAYDFFESDHVEAKEIMAGIAAATVTRSLGQPFVFVAVDGTSVTVVDHGHEHDFGCVGSDSNGARGAKVVDALAIAPDGVVIGRFGRARRNARCPLEVRTRGRHGRWRRRRPAIGCRP
jgi:hypothetical protein